MIEDPYLFGLSKDASVGLLLGFGIATFAFLGVFWLQAFIRGIDDRRRRSWQAGK